MRYLVIAWLLTTSPLAIADSVTLGDVDKSTVHIEQAGSAETRDVKAGKVENSRIDIQQQSKERAASSDNLWTLARIDALALLVTVIGGVLVVALTQRWLTRNKDPA